MGMSSGGNHVGHVGCNPNPRALSRKPLVSSNR